MKEHSPSHNPANKPTTRGKRQLFGTPRRPRAKARGQAVVIVALSLVVLIAMVGLAVDGGSMYNERRVAQNGADGASMAGARTMLGFYEDMIANTTVDQDDWPSASGAAAREGAVRQKIDQYLAANGVLTGTSEAYFVDQNKQIVTSVNGAGGLWCGRGTHALPGGPERSDPMDHNAEPPGCARHHDKG